MPKFFIFLSLIQLVKAQDTSTILTTPSTSTTTEQTKQPISTTQAPDNQKKETNETDLSIIFKNATRYCQCDLTSNFCDLNCCCDHDCSFSERKLFSTCLNNESNLHLLDSKYCYNQNFIFKNNTNYVLERITNLGGLFCIYTDNTKQQSYLMDKKIVKNLKDLNALNLRPEFNWTLNSKLNYDLSTPELIDTDQLIDPYKSEKDIFILNLKRIEINKPFISLSRLKLPYSMVIQNGECNGLKTIKYLTDFSSFCFKWIRNLQDECKSNSRFDFNNYLLLLANGGKMNEPSSKLIIEDINRFCRQNGCVLVSSDNQKTIAYQNQVCSNLVKSVTYQIIYNELDGIKNISVKFEYEDVKQTANEPIRQFQRFEMKFVHENLLNKSMNISHYSGNLGYLFEKPLIIKHRDDETNKTIISPFKIIDLQTPNDDCNPDKMEQKVVLFGLNHRSGCFFNLNKNLNDLSKELQSVGESLNNENICKKVNELIEKIFKQDNKPELKFSSYGKFNVSLLENWTPLLVDQKDNSHKPTILSSTHLSEIKTSCRLLKQVNYLFIYALVADSREPQRKLVSSTKTKVYYPIEICFNKAYCSNNQLELSTSVQFIKMKPEKRMRFASSPAFKLELPEDIFYPFVSANSVNHFHLNQNLILLNSILILMFFKLSMSF